MNPPTSADGWKTRARRAAGALLRTMPGSSRAFGPPRRLHATLEGWAASANEKPNRLHLLAPARAETRPVPAIADAPIRARFERMTAGLIKPQAVAALRNGRYWGRAYGYIITEKDALIAPLSPELKNYGALDNDPRAHDARSALRLPPLARHPGRVLALNTLFCANFHHWLLDTLPKFELLRRAGFSWSKFDGVIFDYRGNRWQNEVLAALGVPRDKIIASDAELHIEADELVVPTYGEPGGNPEKYSYSPEGMDFVRELFLPAERRRDTAPPARAKKILLSRKKAPVRRLHNEHEVLASLAGDGFEAHCLEDYSLREQAALFAGAEAVVMPHGGGLANCVFLPPGARLVEGFNPAYLPTFMMTLAHRRGLRYAALVGDAPPAEEIAAGRADVSDIVVAPARIAEALRAL